MANPWDDLPDAGSPAPWADLPDAGEPAATAEPEKQASQRGLAESAARGAARSTLLGSFSDEAYGAGGAGAYAIAKGIRSLLPGGVPAGAPAIVDVYRQIRDQYRQGDKEANPAAYGAGLAGGVVAQVGPKNIVQAVRSVPGLVQNAPALLRGALTREAALGAAKGALSGGTVGAAQGLGASEADLTRGEVPQAVKDTLTGGAIGGISGGLIGGLTGAMRGGLRVRGEEATDAANKVKSLQDFDQAKRTRANQVIQTKAENKAAIEAQRAAEKAARTEAEATTAARQASLEDAARRPTRDKAVSLLGLETKQNKLGGATETRKLAQKLYDEPFPDGSGRSWVETMNAKTPEEGSAFIEKFRKSTGQQLGGIREELAKNPEAKISSAALYRKLIGSLERLPTEVERQARNELRQIVERASSGGEIKAGGLRKVIEDIEDASGVETSNLAKTLGDRADRLLMRARNAAVGEEKALVSKYLEGKSDQYLRLLDQYGKAKAVELGAAEKVSRINRNQEAVRFPKAGKAPKALPREVAAAVQKPLPFKPEFPGGPEAKLIASDVLAHRTPLLGQVASSVPMVGPIGRKVGEAMMPGLFRSYRPTMDQILQEALTAQQQRSQLDPILRKLLVGGAPMAATGLGIANEDR